MRNVSCAPQILSAFKRGTRLFTWWRRRRSRSRSRRTCRRRGREQEQAHEQEAEEEEESRSDTTEYGAVCD